MLVLGIVIVIGAVVLVLAQAIGDAVRGFSDDLPQIVDEVRHSDLGGFINGGSDSLDTLREHASDITSGVAKVSGGVADVGVSAFGAVTLVFSVIFLTLFGLIDEPRVRDWIGGLLYRDKRERYLQVTDRIIQTTSRYMLGNLAISVICGTVYGVTAVILGLPYPLALALIAGILDLIPNIGATIAGIIIGDRRALGQPRGADRLRDRDRRLPADRELRPAADDHREGGPASPASPCSSASWCSGRCSGSSGRSSACRSRPRSRSSLEELTAGEKSSHRRRGRRPVEPRPGAGATRRHHGHRIEGVEYPRASPSLARARVRARESGVRPHPAFLAAYSLAVFFPSRLQPDR